MSSTNASVPPAYEDLPGTFGNGFAGPPPYHPTTTSPVETLVIPTIRPALSSSFAYHPSLADFNICPSDWSQFTADLQAAIAPTKGQQALAVLGGIGTAMLIGGPWASPCVWRWILRKQVVGNVKKGLTEDEEAGCGKTETVGAMLQRWNTAWADKGVELSLDISEKGVRVEKVPVTEGVKKLVEDVKSEGAKKYCGKDRSRCERKDKCCGSYETYLRVVVQKVGDAAVEGKKKLWVEVSNQDDGMWV